MMKKAIHNQTGMEMRTFNYAKDVTSYVGGEAGGRLEAIAVIFDGNSRPRTSETKLKFLYDIIRLPALKRDVMRLYAALAYFKRHGSEDDFDFYVSDTNLFRSAIGGNAYRNLDEAETALELLHQHHTEPYGLPFVPRRIIEFKAQKLEAGHPGYYEARRNCIAFDTSSAVLKIADRMKSAKGIEELFNAQFRGQDAVQILLQNIWLQDLKADDLHEMRTAIYPVEVDNAVQKRIQSICARGTPSGAMPAERLHIVRVA